MMEVHVVNLKGELKRLQNTNDTLKEQYKKFCRFFFFLFFFVIKKSQNKIELCQNDKILQWYSQLISTLLTVCIRTDRPEQTV